MKRAGPRFGRQARLDFRQHALQANGAAWTRRIG
jgi:hypothetical protein